jgi:ketosteroid isomerase-like protein
MDREALLRAVYGAFNARAIDDALAVLRDDVDWPNGWEGGRVVGREAVREYWTRQWAQIDPTVEPLAVATRPDGCVEVEVRQVVRSKDGDVLSDGTVRHVYAFRGDLVARMDIVDP